jgi:hypothetical protein
MVLRAIMGIDTLFNAPMLVIKSYPLGVLTGSEQCQPIDKLSALVMLRKWEIV